jgi:hypothetical protein
MDLALPKSLKNVALLRKSINDGLGAFEIIENEGLVALALF